jgi:glycosyltransferase involved in cell wall biosynthesis
MAGMRANHRIVLLTPSLERGGAERTVVDIAVAMRRRGWDVSIASMAGGDSFLEELTNANVSVVSFGIRPGRLNLMGGCRLLNYLRRFRPHVIHAHMFHANIMARVFGFILGIPVVCTIHSVVESNRRKDTASLRAAIYRFTDRGCFRTTAVSETVSERFVRDRIVSRGRIQAIPSFVDVNKFRLQPDRRAQVRKLMGWEPSFVWLAVGRLDKAKDYPNLIEAFRRLLDETPSARLAIVGEGAERGLLEPLIAQANLASSVMLLGLRTDIADLMNACDAFVLASGWEGMPIALLEAAACERLIVTTDVGGTSEIVLNNQTGFVVPAQNPEKLSRAMSLAASLDSGQRERFGRLARDHVIRRYSSQAICDRYELLYQESLKSRSAA